MAEISTVQSHSRRLPRRHNPLTSRPNPPSSAAGIAARRSRIDSSANSIIGLTSIACWYKRYPVHVGMAGSTLNLLFPLPFCHPPLTLSSVLPFTFHPLSSPPSLLSAFPLHPFLQSPSPPSQAVHIRSFSISTPSLLRHRSSPLTPLQPAFPHHPSLSLLPLPVLPSSSSLPVPLHKTCCSYKAGSYSEL